VAEIGQPNCGSDACGAGADDANIAVDRSGSYPTASSEGRGPALNKSGCTFHSRV